MTHQRIIGWLLVCVEALAIGLMSNTVIFPATMVVAALVGALSSWRFTTTHRNVSTIPIGLAVVFLLKYMMAPHEFPYVSRFILTAFAHVAAQYVLVLQVLEFYRKRPYDRLSPIFCALGAVVMTLAANVRIAESQRPVTQSLIVAFLVLAALHLGSSRRLIQTFATRSRAGRLIASGSVLLLFASVACGMSVTLTRYDRQIEDFVQRLISSTATPNRPGVSTVSRLGSVAARQEAAGYEIAVRVLANHEPGYLRGMAFSRWNGSEWTVAGSSRMLEPMDQLPSDFPERNGKENIFSNSEFFINSHTGSRQWKELECWPTAEVSGRVLTPLNTDYLGAFVDQVAIDQNGIFSAPDLVARDSYRTFVSTAPRPAMPASEIDARFTEVTPSTSPEVRQLANRLVADCSTTEEKIVAVRKYFLENYRYKTGISVPSGDDPLTHFLIEQPDAHCEYFATGTAILLRLAGVPSRYVTGFVCTEHNDFDESWVARNKDAHAWVEAYDETVGWTIVESTPGAGVPSTAPPASARRIWENLRSWLHRMRVRIQHGGLLWIGRAGLAILKTPWGAGLTVILIVVASMAIRRRWSKPGDQAEEPAVSELHRLLIRMDRRLARIAFPRGSSETLNQFSDRIRQEFSRNSHLLAIARWYRLYALVRYRNPLDFDAVEQLRRELADIDHAMIGSRAS